MKNIACEYNITNHNSVLETVLQSFVSKPGSPNQCLKSWPPEIASIADSPNGNVTKPTAYSLNNTKAPKVTS